MTFRVACKQLGNRGKPLRVVSMPCVEAFLEQPADYRKEVLGILPVLAVEMGVPDPWCRFTGDIRKVIGIDHFGASAPGKDLAEHFEFTAAHLTRRLGDLV